MQFIKPDINIDFIGKRTIAYVLSGLMLLVSAASLVMHNGPRFGIDFAGGSLIQIRFDDPMDLAAIKR